MMSPDGMLILGARVRGKMNKHIGTNCDDWFEIAISGKWSICAVSDGFGARKFSRVGAQAGCQGSVSFLQDALAKLDIKPRDKLSVDILDDEDVKGAEAAMHEAMKAGWNSVEKAFHERKNRKDISNVLQNRDLTLHDMCSTLHLVIKTTIETADGRRSLLLSYSRGNGIVFMVTKSGDCELLMKPEDGDFPGVTECLGPKMLTSHTVPFVGGAKAVLLMTAGVANDYFPYNSRMAELYVDLVLNGIMPADIVSEEQILADLKTTKLHDIESVQKADFIVEVDRLLEKPQKVRLMSAKKYAEVLGIESQELAKVPSLLAVALLAKEKAMPDILDAKERLLVWLDSYQVRGSFYDRTLVLMTEGGTL